MVQRQTYRCVCGYDCDGRSDLASHRLVCDETGYVREGPSRV